MKEQSSSAGIEYILARIRDARARLDGMKTKGGIRDLNEIWEVYCDIEQAILVSKFLFGSLDKLGKIRKLQISGKNDPAAISAEELRSKYDIVDSNLIAAENKIKEGNGLEGVELSRRARDELKILLLSNKISEKSRRRKRRSYSSSSSSSS